MFAKRVDQFKLPPKVKKRLLLKGKLPFELPSRMKVVSNQKAEMLLPKIHYLSLG